MGTLHFVAAILDATPEVAAADDYPHLNAILDTGLNDLANRVNHRKVKATMCLACQGFAAEF